MVGALPCVSYTTSRLGDWIESNLRTHNYGNVPPDLPLVRLIKYDTFALRSLT
jgi:hypothetical protein